jgi:hypothetical protein
VADHIGKEKSPPTFCYFVIFFFVMTIGTGINLIWLIFVLQTREKSP